ncbi:metal ABC transporter permease [Olsenella massiliensis]|uniref:metal ABC transporter permease n=1 Tax=Olsenella massiliensis TaxID=1622075 RepID=UPI00071D14DD|nr:metal ABC transporter permease [Olsenella massiliensis]
MGALGIAELLSLGFIQRALVAGIAIALVCGTISCFVIHLGWSLMGDAVSHAVLPGVVLSYVLGVPYLFGALAAALVAVALMERVGEGGALSSDTSMGIVFTTLFSLGTVLVSKVPSQVNLTHILFGNLLGVTPQDQTQLLVLGAIVLLWVAVRRRDLALLAFDPDHAQALGLRPRRLGRLLLVALAVTVVISLQAVGIILSVALLVTPGATARLITDSLWRMMVIAPLVAVLAVLVGIGASVAFNASTGGMIGVALGAQFALAELHSFRRQARAQAA